MRILVEQLKPVVSKSTDIHYSFWVRFLSPGTDDWITVSGWRYWPAKDTISGPSTGKGGKYFNSTKQSAGVYNTILQEVRRLLGVEAPVSQEGYAHEEDSQLVS